MMSDKRNILVLTYFSFRDGLIQAYTLPYLRIINEVSPDRRIYLSTKEKPSLSVTENEKNGIDQELNESNIKWLPHVYHPFGLRAVLQQLCLVIKLSRFIRKNNIGTVHCWGTPPGVEGYLLSSLTGCRMIIDSYEPHAEAQLENGTWTRSSPGYKVLRYFEKKMSRHAETLIYTTRNMITYARMNYVAYDKKELIKPACVDLKQFSIRNKKKESLLREFGLEDKIVCLYAGKFGGIYHDIEVFQFLKQASLFWENRFAVLLLTSTPREEIETYCAKVELDHRKVISQFVDHKYIADYMGLADFALTPVRSVPTKKCCTPIKDGEYWALGLPIVITKDISDDSHIIEKHNIGAVLNNFTEVEMTKALNKINSLLNQDDSIDLYSKIRPIAEKYRNFEIARNIYSQLYA